MAHLTTMTTASLQQKRKCPNLVAVYYAQNSRLYLV